MSLSPREIESIMAVQKIRIYDLAKELKLDNKRVIDDARREGIDVSVPSNTVPMEVAERIRTKYYPKKIAPAAGPRLVKTVKAAQPEPEHAAALDESAGAQALQEEVEEAPVARPAPPSAAKPDVARPVVKLLKRTPPPPPSAAQPEPTAGSAAPADLQPQTEVPPVEEAEPLIQRPQPRPPITPQPEQRPRSGVQVRVLRPQPGAPPPSAMGGSTVARTAGPARTAGSAVGAVGAAAAEPGVVPPAPTPPSSTPYIPEDTGRPRRRTRRGGKRAGPEFGPEEGKHVDVPRHLRSQVMPVQAKAKPVFTELRQAKMVEGATVKDFSEKLDVKPKDIVQLMLQRGVMATINQTLNPDIAKEIGKEFGWDITFVPFEEMISETEEEKIIESGEEGLATRVPVVTVMGHVDHGKTSLLDGIRETRVAEGEAGGITQHIGAYSVEVPDPDKPDTRRRIVFLDTPGHEAFTMMRARGAKVTDIVVLVVAADDGVMPQTIEAIDHARAAEVPIIVAINKIDKPDAQPDRVKQELADRGLLWDGWGGETVMVEVSAKKLQNLDALLEMIILTADLLELKGNPDRLSSGVVLEAKLDRGRGAVATVLVQQGKLKVGDPFIAGQVFGRVRAMLDDRGRIVEDAGPSTPVEVLGLQGIPMAGDSFQVVQDAAQAQHIANQRQMQARQAAIARSSARGLEQLFSDQEQIKELLVILKGDVA